MKNWFDYLFYTLYRFYEVGPSVWWSEWKALITVVVLNFYVLFSLCMILEYVTGIDFILRLTTFQFSAIILLFYIFHYYHYLHKDKWKDKIAKFKTINKRKDSIGILLIIAYVTVLIVVLVYSFCLVAMRSNA